MSAAATPDALDATALQAMNRFMSWAPFAFEEPIAAPRIARASRVIAYLAAAVAVTIGTAALIGWVADVAWLRDPVGGFVPIRPNAAVMFILSGASVGLSVPGTRRYRWLGDALAAVCAALALTTLAQDVVGRDFGIDMVLFHVPAPRPAAPAALAVVLSSVAVLALDVRPRRGPAIAEVLALAVGTIGWLALGGFIYGAVQFYVWSRPFQSGGVAVNASVALIAIAVGILTARPSPGRWPCSAAGTSPAASPAGCCPSLSRCPSWATSPCSLSAPACTSRRALRSWRPLPG
jgi:hypothetical protein